MNEFYNLRHNNLDSKLAFQLNELIQCYRPHSPPPILNKEDKIIQRESTLEEITRLMKKREFYRNEYIRRENEKAYKELSKMFYEVER